MAINWTIALGVFVVFGVLAAFAIIILSFMIDKKVNECDVGMAALKINLEQECSDGKISVQKAAEKILNETIEEKNKEIEDLRVLLTKQMNEKIEECRADAQKTIDNLNAIMATKTQ
ncbi:MAG: hypothetical protein RLZZ546_397 [Bacteroidota bacterium]|jgi:hypothetical protein